MLQRQDFNPTSRYRCLAASKAGPSRHLERYEDHRYLLPIEGGEIEAAFFEQENADDCIVLLHEALGSIHSWGTFPADLAIASKTNVLTYSRRGHGRSAGPLARRTPERFSEEARSLLPRLLTHFGVTNPILYGHSEGAVLAINYASANPSVQGIILECPYLVKQSFTGTRLQRLLPDYQGSALQRLLSRHHEHPDEVFYSWVNWASTETGPAAVFDGVVPLSTPTLVLQGADDSLGNPSHIEVVSQVAESYRYQLLADGGHFLHRDQPLAVIDAVVKFLKEEVGRGELVRSVEAHTDSSPSESERLIAVEG